MDVHCAFYVLCILLTGSTQATALVVSSPRDMAVANGTWASFECRISCTHVFYWFVGSGRYRRLTDVDVNGFMQRNGIQVEVSNGNECTDNGDYTQQLRILATLEVNGTAVQCAAVPRRPTPNGVFFSSYAVLMVEPIEPTEVTNDSGHSDELSPQPTPSPSSMCPSPSSLPLVCPDPSPEISTSSVPFTVTKTVTSVLVRVVTVTPNPSSPPGPYRNCSERPSSVATSRTQTVPKVTISATGITTDSGQPRPSSSVILLTVLVLLVAALLQP